MQFANAGAFRVSYGPFSLEGAYDHEISFLFPVLLGALLLFIRRVKPGPASRVLTLLMPVYDEGLWQVAEWFTGRGSAFQELMAVNGLSSPELRPGQEVLIPAALLHPAFRQRLRSDDGSLEYDRDPEGDDCEESASARDPELSGSAAVRPVRFPGSQLSRHPDLHGTVGARRAHRRLARHFSRGLQPLATQSGTDSGAGTGGGGAGRCYASGAKTSRPWKR